jgi:hypothetical protein
MALWDRVYAVLFTRLTPEQFGTLRRPSAECDWLKVAVNASGLPKRIAGWFEGSYHHARVFRGTQRARIVSHGLAEVTIHEACPIDRVPQTPNYMACPSLRKDQGWSNKNVNIRPR